MKLRGICSLLCLSLLLAACGDHYSGKKPPTATKGILDLRAWSFKEDGPVRLDGEWETYWSRLLEGTEQITPSVPHDGFYPVPQKSWRGQKLADGRVLPQIGYATFRLKVLLPASPENTDSLVFAFGRTFVNSNQSLRTFNAEGRLLGPPLDKGVVGAEPGTSVPVWSHKLAPFLPSDEVIFIWQISNFHSFKGGPQVAPLMGTFRQVQDSFLQKVAKDFFIIGLLMVMAIYHLVIFTLNTKDKSPFWFGLYCLQIAGFSLIVDGYLNYFISNTLFWQIEVKTYYGIFIFLAVPVFLLFMRSLFPGQVGRKANLFILGNGLMLAAVRLIMPLTMPAHDIVFSYFMIFLLAFLGYVFFVLIKAFKSPDRAQARVLLVGFSVLSATAAYDLMMVAGIIPYTFFLIPSGLGVLIISQAFAIAIKNKKTYLGKIRAEQAAAHASAEAFAAHKKALEISYAKEKAEAANQAKSAFLANMTHELRSPMNAILGFAQVLLRGKDMNPDQMKFVQTINRSGEHLLSLINQVLDLSKIEAGRMTLNPRVFNLEMLLDDVDTMFRQKAEEKQLGLNFELASDLPAYISADELKLRQVLINLLSNALKFTTHGEITVRVRPTNRGGDLILLSFEVADTGQGIAEEEKQNIFEVFEQAEGGKQSQEGTGLGLSISRKFIQLMGGDLTVESTIGQGTTFRFEIEAPRISESQADADRTARRQVLGLEPGQPRYRILIVDDKAVNRSLLREILKPLELDVREAENGEEAVRLWREWKPKVIWMDIRMPVLDGYEASKRIKESPKGKDTVIIAVTASLIEEERAEALAADCDDFLRKPFREQDIFETLARHLGLRYVHARDSAPVSDAVLADPRFVIETAPRELVRQLVQAVERSDMAMIERHINDLRAHQPDLADLLTSLANNFQYERIAQILQPESEPA